MAFRLRCHSELFKELGEYDAIVEFTEVAIRDFIKQVPNGDFNKYLEKKSAEHGIRVNSVKEEMFRSRISQSYILSVFQTFELYLRKLKNEYGDLYNLKIVLADTSDSLLKKTMQKISNSKRINQEIGESRIETFEYYRAIRNKYAHEYIDDKKMGRAFSKITEFKTNIEKNYPDLNAPNLWTEIGFDDFILFTRTVKDIARGIAVLVEPMDETVYISYYRRANLFTKFNENRDRKITALKNDIKERFGITENLESIMNDIVPLA